MTKKIRVTINLSNADESFNEWIQNVLNGNGVGHVTEEGVVFWYYKHPNTLVEFQDVEVLEE